MQIRDLEIAKELLIEKRLTLCIVRENNVILEARSHRISGFLRAVEEFKDVLSKASVADRVVGKAIALLCVYARVRSVYASTLSRKAKELLGDYAIYVEWDNLVEDVLSADMATVCPFEALVAETSDPTDGYRKLKALSDSLKECR